MVRTKRFANLTTSAGLCALTLAGCAQFPSISAGLPSGMNVESNRIRSEILVSPTSFSGLPTYTPVRECTYRRVLTKISGAPETSTYQLTVKEIRDRLLITLQNKREKSTALIARNGNLFDFNILNPVDGTRLTKENYSLQARSLVNQTQATYGPSAHSINDLAAIFPHYIGGPPHVGNTVAQILDENENVWASYVYRGKAEFRGKSAIVIDLMRNFETQNGRSIMVGFNVVDASTMLPLFSVVDAGYRLQFEQVSC